MGFEGWVREMVVIFDLTMVWPLLVLGLGKCLYCGAWGGFFSFRDEREAVLCVFNGMDG